MDGRRHTNHFPENVPDDATIYVTSPDEQVGHALRDVAERVGLEHDEPFEGVLTVNVTPRSLRALSDGWTEALSKLDLKDARCRLVSPDSAPSLSDLMRTQRLWDLIHWIDGQWVQDLLKSQRLVTFFQPIVCSAEPSRVFAYECLLRGLEDDGRLIPPMRVYSAARAVGLLESLDEAARLRAVESASQNKLSGCVFINVNPRSIDEPAKSFASTIEAVLASEMSPERFVFEVVESEKIINVDKLLRLLDVCREVGCRVALDDVGEGYSSLNLLARIKPDFIKVDMSLVRDVDHDPYMSRVTAKVLELAKDLQVETVVEGVETISQWQWVAEHKAEYAQGYLFARPARIPPPSAFSGSPEELAAVGAPQCEIDEMGAAERTDS